MESIKFRINDQFRIILKVDNGAAPPLITIYEIGDPH